MSEEVASYILVIHGRGILKTCITKGTLDVVLERADACLLSGFEVHVYSLKLETNNRPSFLPDGITPLQQEFHQWDAHDDFHELTESIVHRLDEHTVGMSKKYLEQCIGELQDALAQLDPSEGSEHIEHGPTFDHTTGT